MATITPFLMFTGQAEAAMTFYTSLFQDGKVLNVTRYGAEHGDMAGKVYQGAIALNGRAFRCFDSPVPHDFGFTPAISLFVDCDTEAEVDRLFTALSDGGQVMMPLGPYPFSPKFAWLSDRYGVSWQINLKA